jgi:peptidoglycan/xylan/chitin deacetylase (PgdA/CDA1 family)
MEVVNYMYHDVVAHSDALSSPRSADVYKIDEQLFEAHVKALLETSGTTAKTIGDILSPDKEDDQTGHRQYTLSFDDGQVGAIRTILPILAKYGAKGHFFIPTSFISKPGYLSADEIRSVCDSGHDIGSHGHSHNPERNDNADEWKHSIATLQDILGREVTTASVPCGRYRPAVASAASAAGIKWLFTSEPTTSVDRVDGSDVLGRYFVKQHTTTKTVLDIFLGNFPARERQLTEWNVKKKARQIAGTAYMKIRKWKVR